MLNLKEIVADFLEESAQNIRDGSCGLNDDELQNLASQIMHIEISKREAASILNMSTRNFDRKILNGQIPKGIKGLNNNLVWYKDEILNIK